MRLFVIMNKYPYNNGHIMVCPYRHIMALADLAAEETHEIMDLIQRCTVILEEHFNCEGINVGLNQGQATKARASGNICISSGAAPGTAIRPSPTVFDGEVRTMPEHLSRTYAALRYSLARREKGLIVRQLTSLVEAGWN